MWADGKTETYAFTEVDHSLSGGLLIKGNSWKRADDTVGLAFAVNGLSNAHRRYLAVGGIGVFLGDGQLNYKSEYILEAFYNIKVARYAWVTLDLQHIQNPAYNADRGPVNFAGIRLHTEF